MTQAEINQIVDAVTANILTKREMNFLESLEIIRLQAFFEGWKAENKLREMRGEYVVYDELHFSGFAEQLQQMQKQYIEGLKRSRRSRKGNSNVNK